MVRNPDDGGDGWGDDPDTSGVDESANDDYGDLHLQETSFCIDAGDNTAVPPDTVDLDDDGDTTEPIPFDLDGSTRIWDGDGDSVSVVDMGAHERAGEPMVWVNINYTGGGENDGHLWGHNAFSSIQDGIDAVGYGAVVYVAGGTYRENITLKNGVSLVGVEETNIGVRHPRGAIIDGGSRGSVVIAVDCDSNTLLDRFIITKGTGSLYKKVLHGGGIYNANGSPTITNCILAGNSASLGGGMHNRSGSPTIMGCTFVSNTADSGGGIHNYKGHPKVSRCIFNQNSAHSKGGGVYSMLTRDLEIRSCTFTKNLAEYGGGIFNLTSDTTISNCTFSLNSAQVGGGALYNDASDPSVINCIMWGDRRGSKTDEIGNHNSTPTIAHCDIEGSGGSGGHWNTSLGKDGSHNIDADPLFVSSTAFNPDLHLRTDSPCIDTGHRSGDYSGQTDIDSDPRVSGSGVHMGVDMGSDEVVWDGEQNLTLGQSVLLNPGGGRDDPTVEPLVNFESKSPIRASVAVVEMFKSANIQSELYMRMPGGLTVDTTLPDGKFFMTVMINFDKSLFGSGIGRDSINVMYYDPDCGEWVLAVLANTANSPGHDGPIGNRFDVVAAKAPTLSSELGDYGVYRDLFSKSGFAWANVDHRGAFAIATATGILGDFEPDGDIDLQDFATLASSWASRPGDADWAARCNIGVPADNAIGFDDLRVLADNWLAEK